MPSYLLEVGTEELPADFVDSALAQWQTRIPQDLAGQRLAPGPLETYGTPRRLAVLVRDLPAQQPDRQETVKGPPASTAFDGERPTQAAQGFARQHGVAPEELELHDTDKGRFAFARKTVRGRPTSAVLQALTPDWIFNLEGRRFMRWGDGELRFSRPIRWLVALWDDAVLPLELANGSETLASDRYSWGHRVLHPGGIAIPQAEAYAPTLRQAGVEPDIAQRRHTIATALQQRASECGGEVSLSDELLAEVTNLVEWPTAIAGQFDSAFLQLPPEVVTTAMESHQKCASVWAQGQRLLPHFVTAANGDPAKADAIAAGNERVIRARLADAQFFYQADRQRSLGDYMPELERVTFQEQLGSIGAKVARVRDLAAAIAAQLQLPEQQAQDARRAAELCKADLVTQMVDEFPELEGVMGEKYARASGESEAVAVAIAEHYQPRDARDHLPEFRVGQVVGMADRLDTLAGIFSLGMRPSGSSDPFALRRAANATVSIIWAYELPLDLQQLLQAAADGVAEKAQQDQWLPDLQAFFEQRMRALLQEAGFDRDAIAAALSESAGGTKRALQHPTDARARVQLLQQLRQSGELDAIYEPVNRAARLAAKGDLDPQVLDPGQAIRPEAFAQASEQALYQALQALSPKAQVARDRGDYRALIEALAQTAPTVRDFFDGPDSVLVMAEDAILRQNRLNLLGVLRNCAYVLADFSQLAKS